MTTKIFNKIIKPYLNDDRFKFENSQIIVDFGGEDFIIEVFNLFGLNNTTTFFYEIKGEVFDCSKKEELEDVLESLGFEKK